MPVAMAKFYRPAGARSAARVRRVTAGSRRTALFLCAMLDNGGAERHWASLLPALHDRGVGVRLVALQGGGRALEELRSGGVPVRELGRSGVRSLSRLPAVIGELRGGADAVVTFGYNAHAIGALAARACDVPHVLNWHRQEGWPMNRLEAGAVQLAAALGAGAIAVTNAQLPDLLGLGFPSARLRVVSNGVPPPKGAFDRTRLRADLGLAPGDFVAVVVARLRPEKRITDFIDSLARLRSSRPNAHGIVVGDGPLEEELRAYASQRDAPVRFVGYQRDPTQYIRAADVVCLSSSHEALPMALVEALACGRPCVATNVGGAAEIVQEGSNGYLIPVGDVAALTAALDALADSPNRAHEMGERSLARWQPAVLVRCDDRRVRSTPHVGTRHAGQLESAVTSMIVPARRLATTSKPSSLK